MRRCHLFIGSGATERLVCDLLTAPETIGEASGLSSLDASAALCGIGMRLRPAGRARLFRPIRTCQPRDLP